MVMTIKTQDGASQALGRPAYQECKGLPPLLCAPPVLCGTVAQRLYRLPQQLCLLLDCQQDLLPCIGHAGPAKANCCNCCNAMLVPRHCSNSAVQSTCPVSAITVQAAKAYVKSCPRFDEVHARLTCSAASSQWCSVQDNC